MTNKLSGSREWRVTLALRWAYIEHLEVSEIKERFEEEGIGSLSERTIRNYLSEEEADEVRDQIREKHADARIEIAEREEQAYQRARQDERRATRDEKIYAARPQMKVNESDDTIAVRDWEVVPAGDDRRPEWAVPRDTIVEFVEGTRKVPPGSQYPVPDLEGNPTYSQKVVGVRRDQPDLKGRQSARYEQTKHLEARGEVLGVHEDTLRIEGELEVEESLDDESREALVGALEDLRGDDE